MKKGCNILLVIVLTFVLTGCFGEKYEFYPPTILIDNGLVFEELVESNSEWKGEGNKPLIKHTRDWFAMAKEQPSFALKGGDDIMIHSSHGDYLLYDIKASLWLNENEKTDLYVEEDYSIQLPKKSGTYVLELTLETDQGNSQYVGHLILK